jgi:hypothetical protein
VQLKQFRPAEKNAWDFIDWHQAGEVAAIDGGREGGQEKLAAPGQTSGGAARRRLENARF